VIKGPIPGTWIDGDAVLRRYRAKFAKLEAACSARIRPMKKVIKERIATPDAGVHGLGHCALQAQRLPCNEAASKV